MSDFQPVDNLKASISLSGNTDAQVIYIQLKSNKVDVSKKRYAIK
jgi:hypothetical protein